MVYAFPLIAALLFGVDHAFTDADVVVAQKTARPSPCTNFDASTRAQCFWGGPIELDVRFESRPQISVDPKLVPISEGISSHSRAWGACGNCNWWLFKQELVAGLNQKDERGGAQ